jgi:hypothetical protein
MYKEANSSVSIIKIHAEESIKNIERGRGIEMNSLEICDTTHNVSNISIYHLNSR